MSQPNSSPPPASSLPERPRFQFTLRTLLLLFVVLASSMGVFGSRGILVFALAVGLVVYVRHAESLGCLGFALFLMALPLIDLVGLALAMVGPGVADARHTGNWTPFLQFLAALAVWLLSVGVLFTRAVRGRKRRPVEGTTHPPTL